MRTLIIIFLFISCNNNPIKPKAVIKTVENVKNGYPGFIDSLGINSYFDTAKFYLYSYHCDKRLVFSDTTKTENIYFSYLPLVYDTAILRNDTIEIYFVFKYNDKTVKSYSLKKPVYLKNGIAFNLKTGLKLYMTTDRNLSVSEVGKTSRFVNAMQPDVSNFLIRNKEKLDPWFREQLTKQKIISMPVIL